MTARPAAVGHACGCAAAVWRPGGIGGAAGVCVRRPAVCCPQQAVSGVCCCQADAAVPPAVGVCTLLLFVCKHRTCWFHEARLTPDVAVACEGTAEQHDQHAPLTTLLALEATIKQRRRDMEQQTGVCVGRRRGGGLCAALFLASRHTRAVCWLNKQLASLGFGAGMHYCSSVLTPSASVSVCVCLCVPLHCCPLCLLCCCCCCLQRASRLGRPSCCQTPSCCAKRWVRRQHGDGVEVILKL